MKVMVNEIHAANKFPLSFTRKPAELQ